MSHQSKRKSIRLEGYDYSSNGFYFVTICTYNRKPIINKYENKIEEILVGLPRRFPGLLIDYYNLMPTHIHAIFIFEGIKVPLCEVVRSFKALVSKTIGKKNLWQRNYYEHVIRTEKALNEIRVYIRDNPLIERVRFEQFYETGSINRTPT